TAGLDDPLAGPRVTVLGEVRAITDGAAAGALKAAFLARHPGAAAYADFTDFRVYRMAVDSAHLVAGFGRIHWLTAAEIGAAPEAAAKA
ncbi:MAG TPA: heme iron utilization protein, partial [Kiloniellales bacterium]